MDYIKELLTGNQDQGYIHQRFVKYSKGTFSGPEISIQKAGSTIKITGSHEYVDAVTGLILRNSQGRIKASGSIFSKSEILTDLAGKVKKKLGVYNTEIKGEADAKTLLDIYDQNEDATFYLDLETEKAKLKTKKKAPRPGSGSDEFFTASLDPSLSEALFRDICFDCQNKDYKEMKISHTYQISEIVIPEEYKNDAAKARLNAKRKGTLKRKVEIDGVATETEKALLV
jgi:hypothetical protein